MKDKVQNTKKVPTTKKTSLGASTAQITATGKKVEEAWAIYEEKDAAYEHALKQHAEKSVLTGLLASAKIARLTYKIKKIEHKLVKANWKLASKSDKKSDELSQKDIVKTKSKKTDHKAPKDSATKGKSISSSSKAKLEQKGKKKSAAQE